MMRKFVFGIVLVGQVLCAQAQSREAMIERLNQLTGLEAAYANELQANNHRMAAEVDKAYKPLFEQLGASPELEQEMKAIIIRVADKYKNAVTAKDMMRLWSDNYYVAFTDDEIKALLAFKESPLGIKSDEAAKMALPKYTQALRTLTEPIQKAFLQDYALELHTLVDRVQKK